MATVALFRFNGTSTRTSPSQITRPSASNRRLWSWHCAAPMMVTMSSAQSYWATADADIEAHLKEVIPMRPPLSVYEPMRHFTFAAPRTAAPALCIAACELVCGHRDDAMPAACAIHIMHVASYTHEQLPCTDRLKPNPAVHHKYAPNIELLVPDGMVPFAMEFLAQSDNPTGNMSDRILRAIIEITHAFGSQGVIEGRYYELLHSEMSLNDGGLSEKEWAQVVEKKEGMLHACGAACGAIMGGGSEWEIEKLRRYGFYVGKIQKIKSKNEREKDKRLMKLVEGITSLCMEELKDFDQDKIEPISSFFLNPKQNI